MKTQFISLGYIGNVMFVLLAPQGMGELSWSL